MKILRAIVTFVVLCAVLGMAAPVVPSVFADGSPMGPVPFPPPPNG